MNADETAQADAVKRAMLAYGREYYGETWAEHPVFADDQLRAMDAALTAAGWCPVPSVDDEQAVQALSLALLTAVRDEWGDSLAWNFNQPMYETLARAALRHLTATPQQEEGTK